MFIIYLGVLFATFRFTVDVAHFFFSRVAHSRIRRINSMCVAANTTCTKLMSTMSQNLIARNQLQLFTIANVFDKLHVQFCLEQRALIPQLKIYHVKCLFLLQTCASARPHSEFLWYRSSAKHKNVVYFTKIACHWNCRTVNELMLSCLVARYTTSKKQNKNKIRARTFFSASTQLDRYRRTNHLGCFFSLRFFGWWCTSDLLQIISFQILRWMSMLKRIFVVVKSGN